MFSCIMLIYLRLRTKFGIQKQRTPKVTIPPKVIYNVVQGLLKPKVTRVVSFGILTIVHVGTCRFSDCIGYGIVVTYS